jgi:hypothetical protein
MAAVFDSAIDKALFAVLEAADADAAGAVLDAFAASACSLLTWACKSASCASKGLRSVQPAETIARAKITAFGFSVTSLCLSKVHRPVANCHRTPFATTYSSEAVSICHRKWQRIDERPRSRSGRRVGPARLTRRCRASTWMYERLDQTENMQPAVITSKAKMEAFAMSLLHSFVSKANRTQVKCRARPLR